MSLSQVALPLGRLRGQRTHATRLHHQRTTKDSSTEPGRALVSAAPIRLIPGPLQLEHGEIYSAAEATRDIKHAFVQFWVD